MESYVVTGAGRGVGRAIAERLAEHGHVVVADVDSDVFRWTHGHPRVTAVAGDAGTEAVVTRAAETAEESGLLVGWVNNAAVFRDASLHEVSASEVLELIALNLGRPLMGCAAAIPPFFAGGPTGAILHLSSPQAPRP